MFIQYNTTSVSSFCICQLGCSHKESQSVSLNNNHLFLSHESSGWLWLCLALWHMSFQSVIQGEGAAPIWDMLFSQQRPEVQKVDPNYVGAFKASIRIWRMSHLLIFHWPSHLSTPGSGAGKYRPFTGRHWKSHVEE